MFTTGIDDYASRKMTIEDVDVHGKFVFVRLDMNVPLDEHGTITDDTRIVSSLETIRYLMDRSARIILASHLGRPRGKAIASMSLAPVAERLSELLDYPVLFLHDCIGSQIKEARDNLAPGNILFLENLRFRSGETKNSETFAAELADGIDIFVNDAFGTSHRDQASLTGIPLHVPVSVAGLLLKREIRAFQSFMVNPKKPFIAILGGAKVSDKIRLIQKLLEKVDKILIGGGMAYTFLKAQGVDVGNSLVENDFVEEAGNLINEAADLGISLVLPVDNVVANMMGNEVKISVVRNENIPSSWLALDIGPETVRIYAEMLEPAKTVFWNGPMGVFEKECFREGTLGVAQAIASSKAVSLVGGGDTVAAVKLFNLAEQFTHLSTGGGASLEFLQGKILPGIAALTDRVEE